MIELTGEDVTDLSSPASRFLLVKLVRSEGIGAIVIDPVTSASSIDPNKGEQVRPLLEALAGICEQEDLVLLLVLHDRKGSAQDRGPSADMVKGSQEWTAVPRVNLRLALDPATEDGPRADTRRLVGPVATNLSGVVGCREALSVQVSPAAWEWRWTTGVLGAGIEHVWAGRYRARVADQVAENLSSGRDARSENAERTRQVRLDAFVSAVREGRVTTRSEASDELDLHPRQIREIERDAASAELVWSIAGTGRTATRYTTTPPA